jgi:hypothetical protein
MATSFCISYYSLQDCHMIDVMYEFEDLLRYNKINFERTDYPHDTGICNCWGWGCEDDLEVEFSFDNHDDCMSYHELFLKIKDEAFLNYYQRTI